MESLLAIKQALHSYCTVRVNKNISEIEQAIAQARESANSDTKSSAGDKHETGRALMHLEQEKMAGQLTAALRQKQLLDKITPNQINNAVIPGSLLLTDGGNFYVSISIGKILHNKKEYYVISPESPIALGFKSLKAGETLVFNNRTYKIEQIV